MDAPTQGGTGTGGIGTGGIGTGGIGTGGIGTGGIGTGGVGTGGVGTGGIGTSGVGTGGVGTGGIGTGGIGTGGIGTGGIGTGGIGTGGIGTGGIGTGGIGTGGSSFSYAENTGASCAVSSGALTTNAKLPDPFAMHDGTRITALAQWECRRNEIKADIEQYEIGPKPDPSSATVSATLSGGNLSVVVTTSSGSLTIKSGVSGSGSCVAIPADMDLGLITGCTKVTFSTSDVIPYNSGSTSQNRSDPFYRLYPDLWGKIGNFSAWAWGISRLIDGLAQVKDQLGIDMTKIAVHGCSYAGRMALFAGALDERIALTVAQESGGGGVDAWRTSQDFVTRTGVSVEKIDNTNYAWYLSSMRNLDPYSLPHDHHELIAMIAPRAVIVLGNDDYDWLCDESGYKSTMAAIEVFKALGVPDHIGYDFTSSHAHCSAPTTQKNSVNAFVSKFLKGNSGISTNIAIVPPKSGLDLNYAADIDWTTPALQ